MESSIDTEKIVFPEDHVTSLAVNGAGKDGLVLIVFPESGNMNVPFVNWFRKSRKYEPEVGLMVTKFDPSPAWHNKTAVGRQADVVLYVGKTIRTANSRSSPKLYFRYFIMRF